MLDEKRLYEVFEITRKYFPERYEKWLNENQEELVSLLINCISDVVFAPDLKKEEWNFGEAIDKVFESEI